MEDMMCEARLIWRRDPLTAMAESSEDTNFRAFFGCGAEVAMIAWDMMASLDLLPVNAIITHFLWALMFMKVYATTKVMQVLCGGIDNETMMQYVMKFVHALAYLESDVVRRPVFSGAACLPCDPNSCCYLSCCQIVWENRYRGDVGADCLISVDCTDVKCPNWGPAFSTYKHGKKGGLRYEVGICIQTGDVVWINGPYPAGRFNDITIFRDSLMSHLDDGERAEADGGYRGECPQHVKCPSHLTSEPEAAYMAQRVRSRQETINKNLKDWTVLQVIYRNDPGDHPYVFRACCVMKQIGINNGKKLFQTGYKDPPYDPPDPNNPPQNTGWQRANYIGGDEDNNNNQQFHFL